MLFWPIFLVLKPQRLCTGGSQSPDYAMFKWDDSHIYLDRNWFWSHLEPPFWLPYCEDTVGADKTQGTRLSEAQIQRGESQCTSGSICSLIVLWNFSLPLPLIISLTILLLCPVNILSLPYLSPTLISRLPFTLPPKPHSHWLAVCEDKRRASCPFCHSRGLLQCHQVPTGTCWEVAPLPEIHLPACPWGALALSVPGNVIRTAALEAGLAPCVKNPTNAHNF